MNRWEEYQTHRAEVEEILSRSRHPKAVITRSEVELLLGNNYSAVIYPRKKLVVVNGYHHYRLIK